VLHESVKSLYETEKKLDKQFNNFVQKPLPQSTVEDIQSLLQRLNLSQYAQLFLDNKISGEYLEMVDEPFLMELGMTCRDACCLLYHRDLIVGGNYLKAIENREECAICFHDTPSKTSDLLQEYNIELDEGILKKNNWIAPYLLYATSFSEFGVHASITSLNIRKQLEIWKKTHKNHILGHN
ncbi:MAG: hypothetical protein NXI00_23585, partial [Cytophagales bacterium]|nr:hypothetical protein [Cytophagales bacterium]